MIIMRVYLDTLQRDLSDVDLFLIKLFNEMVRHMKYQ